MAGLSRSLRATLQNRRNLAVDISSFAADSDYRLSTASTEVLDPTNDAIRVPNMILCLLGTTRAEKFFNQGPFTAMVDMSKCGNSGNQEDQGLMAWVVDATSPPAGATTGDYRLAVWLDMNTGGGGSGMPPVVRYVFDARVPKEHVTFPDGPDSDPVVGDFTMRISLAHNSNFRIYMKRTKNVQASGVETFEYLNQSPQNPANPSSPSETHEAVISQTNRNTGASSAKVQTTAYGPNGRSPVITLVGIRGDFMARQQGSNTAQCISRRNVQETASSWGSYTLFDNTGKEVQVDTYIDLKQTIDGQELRAGLGLGDLNKWRPYSSSSTPANSVDLSRAFVDQSTVYENTWGSSGNQDQEPMTLSLKQGRLRKFEKYTLSPVQFAGQNMTSWISYRSGYTYSSQRVVLQFQSGQLYNMSGPTAVPFSLAVGDSIQVNTAAFGYSWGELRRTPGGTYQVVLSRVTTINPGSTSHPTNLVCINADRYAASQNPWDRYRFDRNEVGNCLNAASLGTATYTSQWGRQKENYATTYGLEPLKLPTRANFSAYTFDAQTNTLMQGGVAVKFPQSNGEWMVGNGTRCGPSTIGTTGNRGGSSRVRAGSSNIECSTTMTLMEDTDANYQTLGCSGQSGLCTSADLMRLDVYYEWDVGQGPQTGWLTKRDGSIRAPSPPLSLEVSISDDTPRSLSRTNFKGTKSLVTYETNTIRGLPAYCVDRRTSEIKPATSSQYSSYFSCYDSSSSGSSNNQWEQVGDFVVPVGSQAVSVFSDRTQYVLKPRRLVQIFPRADDASSCQGIQLDSTLTLPSGSNWVNVNIGDKPTNAPTYVVDGNILPSAPTS